MKGTVAVIFDLDGTLLDTLDDLTDAVNFVIDRRGFPVRTRDEVRSFVGNGARLLVERAIYSKNGEIDVEVEDVSLVDSCFDEFKRYYGDHVNVKTKPYEGIVGLMHSIKSRGIAMAVVSNKPDKATKMLCGAHFDDLLSFSVGEREGVPKKPCPDAVIEAIAQLSCDKAIYVGDSEVDVITAKNAEIPSILVTWGFRNKEFLRENGGEIFADNCEELERQICVLLDVDNGEDDVT